MSRSDATVLTHTVFSTKDRFAFLDDPLLRRELHLYVAKVLHGLGCGLITVGGVADHIHILCTLSKTVDIAKTIINVKRASSLWIKKRDKEMLGFSWQSSYKMFSVDISRIDKVRTYIETQEKHHLGMSFQDEVRRFYKHYGMELNESEAWN
jgi:REP element-mobilizing transposase RayT